MLVNGLTAKPFTIYLLVDRKSWNQRSYIQFVAEVVQMRGGEYDGFEPILVSGCCWEAECPNL